MIVMKNKLIIIKYKCLFVCLHIEIYDDKNLWSNIFTNTNFFKEVEHLFNLAHGSIYNGSGGINDY
jgi:hypothetical protein